jgi:two-component system sensor histidine kinase UhpB
VIELRIRDDGRGVGGAPEGAGLRGMRERALLIGADLTVGPALGRGTEIRLRVPLGGVRVPLSDGGPLPLSGGGGKPND